MFPPVASQTRMASLWGEWVPASAAGLDPDVHPGGGHGPADLLSVFGQKGLVRGDDRFPLSDRIMKEFPGGPRSAHKLEHDVDARVPGHLESVGGQNFLRIPGDPAP